MKAGRIAARPQEDADDEALYGICLGCGRSHDPKNRRRLIRLMVDAGNVLIQDAWPCFYPPGPAGERRLFRDLRALRSTTPTQTEEHA